MIPSSWYQDWSGFRVAVFGLGKSGFSVADTLIELGSKVTVFARGADPELLDLLGVIGAGYQPTDDPADFEPGNFDFVVASPGFPPNHPLIQKAIGSGLKLVTDIDLAWRLRDKVKPAKWITITGTNGKTTTTELCEAMLLASGQRAVACGNIGSPILDAIRDPQGFDYLVVELSSFQLHYLDEIAPVASVFLNLAEDHLDWHGNLDLYFAAKSKVYQNTELAIVYNEQDPKTLAAAEAAEVQEGCRAVAFTLAIPAVSAVGYVEEFLVDRAFIENRRDAAQEIVSTLELDNLAPLSPHLKANIAAATALCRAVGVAPNFINLALKTFRLSKHRIEKVAELNRVSFIDDSKATNAHAADAALKSFESVVWIVGGLLKGVDPEPLIRNHLGRLRAAVVIGADTSELERLFSTLAPNLQVRVVSGGDVMQQAVSTAFTLAEPGDTVLLAPAAASMDQFKDYVDRGNQFQAAVRALGDD